MKKFELLAASAIALIAAVPATAQTAPAAPAPAAAADVQDDTAGPDNDIVITATKRATTLQDTPISVSVTTSESIERAQVRDLLDLQTLVPSLKVGQLQSSANTNFIIRGFGNGANNIGIEPSVAVFIDGVYRSRSSAQISDLPNIQRVEVLRGPQSTLFGKNASAGVISIVTEVPKFEFGGSAEASYGNYNAVVLKGDITGPITKTVAFSLAGNYNRRDGYANYVNLGIKGNNRNRYGFRGQLLFEPSSDFKIRLIGDYDRINEICCTVANLFDGPTGAAVRGVGGQVNSNQRFSYDSYANFPSVTKIDNYGFSGQIDYSVTPQLALTSISSYRRVKTYTNADSDFTSADLIGSNALTTKVDTYTQELRLASSFDGPINFLIGGFYFKEDIKSDGQLTFGNNFKAYANLLTRSAAFPTGAYSALEPTLRALLGLPASTPATAFGAAGQGRFEHYKYGDEAYSIFGQVDLKPVEGLTFTAGFNYTNDRKKVSTNDSSTDTFSALDLVQAGFNYGVTPVAFGGLGLTPAQATVFASNRGTGGNPFLALQPLQFLPPFLNFPNAVESGKTHDDNLSYTLRAAYKFNRNVNVYASYATGFKASSFNLSYDSRPFATDFIPGSPIQSPAASPIRTAGLALANLTAGTRYAGPEKAQVYEVGLKGNFEGFGINVALFKQILKGFQSNVFQGTGFVLANAEQQSTKGAEIDATMSPTKNLTFTASLTYLDPVYDKFTGGSSFNPATNTVVPTNLTGATPSGISKYSIAVGGTYTVPFGNDKAVILHVDYAHDSAFKIAQGLPYKASPESLNASVSLQVLKGLELSVWGRNLTEPKYNPVIFPGVAQSGTLSAYPSPPRTYGVDARFKF
ncbi:TonB-dependent receptor [Sphingomonas panacisoli]|uniref:TonB-dependent receptor n=1 Tax=Sphingomonas panacisoli TaxID=1813879 RepID=A0A5B8LJQ3_9SPHN|nr:TonB-dependent receptor [Sphingomonas panacisoli]QDZ07370.1 TonB-dependent receptor [Sphingomonas panacisoli]